MPDTKTDGGFDLKLTLLPPDLVAKLWTLGLDANTSRVNIAYQEGAFTTALQYSYGGSVSANLGYRRDSTKVSVGVDPANSKLDLNLVYRGFNFSASDNMQKSALSLNLGYGAPLLPFPDELDASFQAANAAVQRMGRGVGSAINNPLSYYNLHSNDVNAIGDAIRKGQSIYSAQKNADANKDSLGVGLRLNYTPQTGLVIYGAVGFSF